MKRTFFNALCFASLMAGASMTLAGAQGTPPNPPASAASAPKVELPPGITEEMLAPPPVPAFMLRPPAKPLTVDEMVQQAREAEQKAGIRPAPKPAN